MNKFAPKSEFLKERAKSLHRSGYPYTEIGKMLRVSKVTAAAWIKPEKAERTYLRRALARAEEMGELRRSAELPVLAFVPQIKLTDKSKYRMVIP